MGSDTPGLTRILERRQPPALSESERKVIIEAIEANVAGEPDIHADWAQTVARPYFDQLASLQRAGLDLGSLPDLRTRTAQHYQVQTPLRAVDLDRCDVMLRISPPYLTGIPEALQRIDGPDGRPVSGALTEPSTGTISLGAIIGNVPGLLHPVGVGDPVSLEGSVGANFDWELGKMNWARGRLVHVVPLSVSFGGLSRPAEYVVEFDVRAGDPNDILPLGGYDLGTASLASVTAEVMLATSPNVVARVRRLVGKWLSPNYLYFDRIFTLRVTTRGPGNVPGLAVSLHAEVSARVAGAVTAAGFAYAVFQESYDAPVGVTPTVPPLGGIELSEIRVYRCPVELERF